MSKGLVKNTSASIHQRLLNVSRETGRSFNDLVLYYAMERFLHRLSKSKYHDRFVLKGALMLFVWNAPITRVTRDIDLPGRISNDFRVIGAAIAEICSTTIDGDGLVFDPQSIVTEPIAEDADYQGVRVRCQWCLGNMKILMQIDIGFSDVMTPDAMPITYPSIFDHSGPRLHGYNRETAIAEKFEAMVKLGELNTRMKDFFDVWLLSGNFAVDGRLLATAISVTFNRRQACTSTLADGDSSNAGEDLPTMAEMIGPLCRIHAIQRLAKECDQALYRFDRTMTSIPQTDFCVFAQRECRLLRDGNQRAKARRTVVRGSYGG